MHTDLSPHLHTSECNTLIEQLNNCHIENQFAKFLGVCNDIDNQLVRCLKRERQARAAANRVKAAERQARLKERLVSS
ncbi:COX assembly mitochondrial protein 2 homolog [Bactrocera oleae]|uniref:COX assembly mitochondrial protein 2 homolog n=1 Tax=Bactrocera oleae TaxID=104688 RepID=UPI0006B735C4|nr:COX assembly mitochondrial protein 2 homolog [Bactrocera oleae]